MTDEEKKAIFRQLDEVESCMEIVRMELGGNGIEPDYDAAGAAADGMAEEAGRVASAIPYV